MLGVGEETLSKYGLVSEETARAMALGALEKSGADAAVSITGLAGPDGDGSSVPVGTVWIGTALRAGTVHAAHFQFSGSRNEVRQKAAREALEAITTQLIEE
jgi:PncC family amidohydrolase